MGYQSIYLCPSISGDLAYDFPADIATQQALLMQGSKQTSIQFFGTLCILCAKGLNMQHA